MRDKTGRFASQKSAVVHLALREHLLRCRQRTVDRAVYAAAWTTAAFGTDAEIKRRLRLWLNSSAPPFHELCLIRGYCERPDARPTLIHQP